MKRVSALFIFVIAMDLAGCASYVTPGRAVSIPEITAIGIGEALARQPAAAFPVQLIVARVQAPGYLSYSNRGYGHGSYTVLTTRDIETDEDFRRISAMPGVASVGPLSRVLLPTQLNTTFELRTAAAQLRGDVILLYTLDTSFRTDTLRIGPVQAVSLGFFPNKKAHVTATCAAAFVDVRTGYVYGVAEGTATEEQRSNVWNTQAAIEAARATAEREAFVGALTELERVWSAILAQNRAGDRIAAELDIDVVDLGTKRISAYDYEHRNRGDDFEPLMKRLLTFDQLIFASPVYWYGVSPAMKVFLDRISDFLELPDLLSEGRRLRGKEAYVVCTSVDEEVPKSFIGAFTDTFDYLGLRFRGVGHANCRDGYVPAKHDADAKLFAQRLRSNADLFTRA